MLRLLQSKRFPGKERNNMKMLPECHYFKAWPGYRREIKRLMVSTNPNYKKQIYIKPIFVLDGIAENPEKYPLLSVLTTTMKKKYISFFLKEEGRIANGIGSNTKVWMLPGHKE